MNHITGDDLARLAAEHHVVPSILTKRFAFAVAELAAAREREACADCADKAKVMTEIGWSGLDIAEAIRKRGAL